ncbi:hypothetical protein N9D63_01875 [Opitutales bacterium]|nr:hypothetical protein [Opitutales bacterium]
MTGTFLHYASVIARIDQREGRGNPSCLDNARTDSAVRCTGSQWIATGDALAMTGAKLKRANAEMCDCGCNLTLAECRNDDTSCRKSLTMVGKLIEEITS